MNDQNDQIRTYAYMQSTTMSLEKEIHTKSTTVNTVTHAVLLCMDQVVFYGRCRHTPFAVARQYHIIWPNRKLHPVVYHDVFFETDIVWKLYSWYIGNYTRSSKEYSRVSINYWQQHLLYVTYIHKTGIVVINCTLGCFMACLTSQMEILSGICTKLNIILYAYYI